MHVCRHSRIRRIIKVLVRVHEGPSQGILSYVKRGIDIDAVIQQLLRGKIGAIYSLKPEQNIEHMARKSKEVESLGALGDQLTLLFQAVSNIMKKGGILASPETTPSGNCVDKGTPRVEVVTPVRKNPENLKLRYCMYVLAVDRVYSLGRNLGEKVMPAAKAIIADSPRKSEKFTADSRYRAAIIEWTKMHRVEFMSEALEKAATDPQNILRFVKENCDL